MSKNSDSMSRLQKANKCYEVHLWSLHIPPLSLDHSLWPTSEPYPCQIDFPFFNSLHTLVLPPISSLKPTFWPIRTILQDIYRIRQATRLPLLSLLSQPSWMRHGFVSAVLPNGTTAIIRHLPFSCPFIEIWSHLRCLKGKSLHLELIFTPSSTTMTLCQLNRIVCLTTLSVRSYSVSWIDLIIHDYLTIPFQWPGLSLVTLNNTKRLFSSYWHKHSFSFISPSMF